MIIEVRPWMIITVTAVWAFWLGWRSALWFNRLALHKRLTPAQRGVMWAWVEENRRNAKAR